MKDPLRRPEEILAYRPLRQIVAAKAQSLWTARPGDSALSAMRLMADKNIGLVLVTEGNAIAGVLSERDCVRRIVLAGKVSGRHTDRRHHGAQRRHGRPVGHVSPTV